MTKMCVSAALLLCSVLTFPGPGQAEEEFTPLGAIRAGNVAGEIPALKEAADLPCPQTYAKGDYLPNPYRDEKPLFRIDRTNLEQHRERLSPGQIARLLRSEKFFMNVYPSHRNMVFSKEFYAATEKSRSSARVDENGILRGYAGGVPFPLPGNGLEAIWNVKRPFLGDDTRMSECRRIVSSSGRIRKSMRTTLILVYDERRIGEPLPNPDGISYKIKSLITSPADEAGTAYLTVGYLDERHREDTWLYMPSLRRVRRAPTLTGGAEMEGESTIDEQSSEFRGSVIDWNWKLLGRKEMVIPYNTYDIWREGAADEDECHAGDVNPERVRYELHRVWVVEGTPKEGIGHPYSRRVGYYDEDTWEPVGGDRYDRRGGLWRTMEFYTAYDYCQRIRMLTGYVYLNLDSGRYELFGGCRTPETRLPVVNTGLKEEDFSVQALRKAGR